MRFDAAKTVDLLGRHTEEIDPNTVVPQLADHPVYQLEVMHSYHVAFWRSHQTVP